MKNAKLWIMSVVITIVGLMISSEVFARAPEGSFGVAPALLPLIIVLAIMFGVFLLLREFYCWYFKINYRIQKEERMIELLEKIYNSMNEEDVPTNEGK